MTKFINKLLFSALKVLWLSGPLGKKKARYTRPLTAFCLILRTLLYRADSGT